MKNRILKNGNWKLFGSFILFLGIYLCLSAVPIYADSSPNFNNGNDADGLPVSPTNSTGNSIQGNNYPGRPVETSEIIDTTPVSASLDNILTSPTTRTGLASLRKFRPDGSLVPFRGKGTGNEFTINDNQIYSNFRITSSEKINIFIDVVTNTVSFHIEPVNLTSNNRPLTSTITISGLEPFFPSAKRSTQNALTLFRHQDGYFQESFELNKEGNYSYVQDISSPHHIYIMPRHGTVYIGLEANEQEPPENPPYTYITSTRTYILTENIDDFVVITASNITLDGNSKTISGPGYGYGIYLNSFNSVTVKNCNIQSFATGLYASSSNNNTFLENTANSASDYGIELYSSDYNVLISNTTNSNTVMGIDLSSGSNYNTLVNNITNSNSYDGINVYQSPGNTFTNNTANSNGRNGIRLDTSCNNNTFTGNTTNLNTNDGIELFDGSTNVFNNNTADSNDNIGLAVYYGVDSILTNNTVISNSYGIYLSSGSNNTVYHNNVYSNTLNAYSNQATELSYNNEGNWWGHTAVPGFYVYGVNNPYDSNAANVVDSYPYLVQDGWDKGYAPGQTDTIAPVIYHPAPAGGYKGQAFKFDGIDDYVSITHNSNLNISSTGFTVSFWVKAAITQTDSYFLLIDKSHQSADGTGWFFQGISSTGYVTWGYGNGLPTSNECITSTTSLLDNQWHHVVGTFNGSTTLALYIDNSSPITTSVTYQPSNNTRNVNIGASWGDGTWQRYFTGLIDEVGIYNSSLSAQDIDELYTTGKHTTAHTCKRPVVISNTAGTLTNHQVRVDVTYDSNMRSDFNDLRFFDISGTALSYWIENYTTGVSATVWVKVPYLASGSNTTIEMHYGNPNAASAGNGNNTFLFFDDFNGTTLDSAKWDTGNYVGENNGPFAYDVSVGYNTPHLNWWNSSWTYRKQITIAGTNDGAQTNYQMKVIINRSTGSDTGNTVYVSDKCLSNYNDIRFTAADGTLLDYWIESSSSSTATIWVEFNSIASGSSTNTNFYMYYGNSGASAVSNFTNTFKSGACYATGGSVTEVSGDRIHTFTSGSTLSVSVGGNVQALVVAGGGGGGAGFGGGGSSGGGGGAGGLVYHSAKAVTTYANITVTVGGGGSGSLGGSKTGGDSVFDDITALGGGGGGENWGATGSNGGSAGGGACGGSGGTKTQGDSGGGTGYGNNGGLGVYGSAYGAGGGGGASAVGSNGTTSVGGNGGTGREYSQFSSVGGSPAGWFAGGGGGGCETGYTAGTGGAGGGGNGNVHTIPGSPGVANTGGGGGGTEQANTSGGAGGSGIVIVRYTFRNKATNEPTWGTWGAEAQYQTSEKILVFDGTRSATDSASEDSVSSSWWGRSVRSKTGITENDFVVNAKMWFSQSSSGAYANQFNAWYVGVGTDKDNYIQGGQSYTDVIGLGREVSNSRTTSDTVAHTYEASTWKDIKFTFVNNGTCEYKIDDAAQTYSAGQTLSTRKITLAFDHRAPSASVIQKVDWVFVRKYASTEPTVSINEETSVDAAFSVPRFPGLVSWWSADETANDLWGDNNGALNGGAGYSDVPELTVLTPTISASYFDKGLGIDVTTAKIFLDDNEKTPASVTNEDISYIPLSNLVSGEHTAVVQVSDLVGNSISNTWTFSIIIPDDVPPDAPDLVSPPDNFYTNASQPVFQWSAVEDESQPVTYIIEIGSDAAFLNIVISQTNLTTTTYTASSLSTNAYYWRVFAKDGVGNTSDASSVRKIDVIVDGNHQGQSWTPVSGTVIGGTHTNIGTFSVGQGDTVYVQYVGEEMGISADAIYISGTLKANSGELLNLQSQTDIYVAGTIDLTDTSYGGTDSTETQGGNSGNIFSGGGGGGYGGYGGDGGGSGGGAGGGTRGTQYSDDIASGSKGGNAFGIYGGMGGRALLSACRDIFIEGTIDAGGNQGQNGGLALGGSGGGSGGGILIKARFVNLGGSAQLLARGGAGGSGGIGGSGGGGGSGGRIKLFAFDFSYDLEDNIDVSGGASGGSGAESGASGTFFAQPLQALPRNQVYDGVGVNPFLGNLTVTMPMAVMDKFVPVLMPSIPDCHTTNHLNRVFNMTYISTGNPASRGSLGNYWSHSFEVWVEELPDGTIMYHHDNRNDGFFKNADDSYTASPGIYAAMTKTGNTYLLTDRYGDKQYFDANGRLTKDESRKGTYIDFEYEDQSVPNFVTKVTDNWDRALEFGYVDGLMKTITETHTGRVWSLAFDANDNFNRITIPGSSTVSITYLTGSNSYLLESIIDSKGVTFLSVAYEDTADSPDLGKVISQSLASKIYAFDYVDDGDNDYTLVTDPNGNQRREYFDTKGFMTKFRQYTNRNVRASDPEYYETVLTRNDNFEVISTTFPKGNSIENAFDINNNDPLARGNLLTITRTSGANELVNSFTYEPNFNQPKTFTDALGRVKTLYYDYEEAGTTDINGDGVTTQTYGNVIKILSPEVTVGLAASGGNQVISSTFWWNGYAQLTHSTDPEGYENSYSYYPISDTTKYGFTYQIARDIDDKNITVTLDYDAAGNVITRTDGKGYITVYTVNTLNQIEHITAPIADHDRAINYDANGNVDYVDVENTGNVSAPAEYSMEWIRTSFGLDSMDRVISQTRMVSTTKFITTLYGFDDNGNPDFIQKPKGNKIKKVFDERDLAYTVTNAYDTGDAATTTINYDGNGNPTAIIDDNNHTRTNLYDGFDRYVGYIDALSNRMDCELDDAGNVLNVVWKNSSGTIIKKTIFLYDEVNRSYEIQQWIGTPATQQPPTGDWAVTKRKFDKRSLVVLVRDDNNHDTETYYDGLGRAYKTKDHLGNTVEYDLDNNSNPEYVTETEYSSGISTTFTTTNTFNALNWLTGTTLPGKTASRSFTRNSRGNVVYYTDAEGNHTTKIYDGLSRLVKTIQEGDIITEQSWDDNSLLASFTDDNSRTTTREYNNLDFITKETQPDSTDKDWTWDGVGNNTGITDANGNQITNTFDDINRLTGRTIITGTGVVGVTSESFGYDGLSQMTLAENNYSSVTMTYNSMGWMTQEEQLLIGGQAKTVAFAYNNVGFRTGLTYPSSKVITFVPDELNRNEQITNNQQLIAEYAYIGPWRVKGRTYGNNTELSVDYDNSRRITDYDHTNTISSTLVAGFEYAYNQEDFKLYEKRTHESKGDAYNLNSIYRLVGVKYGVTNLDPETDYADYTTYDNIETYTFDGVGNRTQVDCDSQTITYSVNTLNQYTSISGTNLTYDNNGNPLTYGSYSYAYDYANRLMEVKYGETTLATFKYDAFGRRISKTNNQPQTTNYVLDCDRVIAEYNENDVLLAEYTFGNGIDEILTMTRSGNTYYYHENTLGSIYAVTDEDGDVVERYEYSAYGMPSFFDGSGTPISNSLISNNYLFTGREFDKEIWLYYYRARYYSPFLGRFLQRDPIGYAGGVNLYSYCNNNPINYTDPMGEDIFSTAWNWWKNKYDETAEWVDKQLQELKQKQKEDAEKQRLKDAEKQRLKDAEKKRLKDEQDKKEQAQRDAEEVWRQKESKKYQKEQGMGIYRKPGDPTGSAIQRWDQEPSNPHDIHPAPVETPKLNDDMNKIEKEKKREDKIKDIN